MNEKALFFPGNKSSAFFSITSQKQSVLSAYPYSSILGTIYVLSFIFQSLQISNSLLEVFGFFSDLVEIRDIYCLPWHIKKNLELYWLKLLCKIAW